MHTKIVFQAIVNDYASEPKIVSQWFYINRFVVLRDLRLLIWLLCPISHPTNKIEKGTYLATPMIGTPFS